MADISRTVTLSSIAADHTVAASFVAAPPVTHVVHISSGPNGSCNPTGDVTVNDGDNLNIVVTADPGFVIDSILVDGEAV